MVKKSDSDFPDYMIESVARWILPEIQKAFSDDNNKELLVELKEETSDDEDQ